MTTSTTDRGRLRDSIAGHEGLRLNPYLCSAGKLTIGYGRNLEARPISGPEWRTLWNAGDVRMTLTTRGAATLLEADMADAGHDARIVAPGFDALDPVRQGVLTEMVFQMGPTRVAAFRRMLDAVRARDFPRAAAEMRMSAWFLQTKQRAETLARRMETGSWT